MNPKEIGKEDWKIIERHKKEQKECSHNFQYSHQEMATTYYGGANIHMNDVVVCTKCGEIKRS